MPCTPFIAIHIGAGYHSKAKESVYKELMKTACNQAMKLLINSNHKDAAVDAVVHAIQILEDSPLTNSGTGSNLNIDGIVECDASLMNGCKDFGSCTGITNIKNPISLAKAILLNGNKPKPLMLVPPVFISGKGAEKFALDNGAEIVDPKELITATSKAMYDDFKVRYDTACREDQVNEFNKRIRRSNDKDESLFNDTVGCIALDSTGKVASGVSSGGLWLKHPGRVGEAASFGSGLWAENQNNHAFAMSVSGTGEVIMKSMLASLVADFVMCRDRLTGSFGNPVDFCKLTESLPKLINTRILNNSNCQKIERSIGFVMLKKVEDDLEFWYLHNTSSMGIGYKAGNKPPICKISRKENETCIKLSGELIK